MGEEAIYQWNEITLEGIDHRDMGQNLGQWGLHRVKAKRPDLKSECRTLNYEKLSVSHF